MKRVITYGTFDLLHYGHINLLQRAKALGDYLAGTNHTLPTSGTARFSSPLTVDDHGKKWQHIYYTEEELQSLSETEIKTEITAQINQHLILGQIENIYFSEYIFLK